MKQIGLDKQQSQREMSCQPNILLNQRLGTIEQKQRTNTNFNTNNSLAFSQTLEDNEDIELGKNLYFQSKQSIQTDKQYQYEPSSQKQLYKRANHSTSSIVLNSLTQKEVDQFIKSLQMIRFLTKQTAQKRLFVENKKNGVRFLRNKIKITENRILLLKQKYDQKAKTYRKRSESVKKTRNSNSKRLSTQIATMKQDINLIKKKLSAPKYSNKYTETGQKRRSSLRFHTEAIQQRIYIPMPFPTNFHQNNPQSPFYQQMYQRQTPNPQTLPIFKRTSQQSNQQYQQKTSQRSSNSTKDKLQSSKHLFDIIGQKLKGSGTQNNLFVPFSRTQDVHNVKKMQKSNSIRIKQSNCHNKNDKSKKSSIFDQSSIKILCQQTNSYSLSQESMSSQISKKEESQMQKSNAVSIYFPSHFIKDFKISNLEESVESKYTSTQRINNLPIAMKKQKIKKSVRFHDSVEDQMNVNDIVLNSKSKFSKESRESKYLPSSLQNSLHNSRSIEGSGFGELHLTSQSIVPLRQQAQQTKRETRLNSSNIKIIQ